VQVIEPEERVQTSGAGLGALLPINPPEINALIFERVMEQREIGFSESRVSNVKGNGFILSRIHPERRRHRGVGFFVGVNTFGWMEVQRGFQSPLVELIDELYWVRE